MEKDHNYFQMEISIKANIRMENLMVLEDMNGVKVAFMRESFLKVCEKEKANG